jgi:ATP synthase protein I
MADQHSTSADDTLSTLRQQVAAAQASHAPVAEPDRNRSTGMAVGMRMASEFVSAIAVGVLSGYGVDWLIGTTPLVLMIGLGLGFATGVVNLVRTARQMAAGVPVGQDLSVSDDADD